MNGHHPATGAGGDGARDRLLLAGALAAFAASRLVVFLLLGGWVSDVGAYFAAASEGVGRGLTAYADFWFPYPPLALAPVYLPALVSPAEAGYTVAFRAEMLLVDLSALALLLALVRRLGVSPGRLRLAVYAWTAGGLAVGHLLYDRLDLVVAGFFLAHLLWLPDSPRRLAGSTVVAWAGILFKVVPLFWLPLLWLAEWVHRGRPGEVAPRRFLGFLGARAALQVAPPALVLWLWNLRTGGGLVRWLGEHGERGVEIESVWATPVWLGQRLLAGVEVPVVTRWGGQHLAPWLLTDGYLWLARWAGFALLAALYAWLAVRLRRHRGDPGALPRPACLLAGAAVLLLLLATQRVLSPQYLIWVLPALAALLALGHRTVAVVGGGVFLLTFELFGRHYWALAAGETYPIAVLTARNALLVGLAGWLVARLVATVRRTTGAGGQPPPGC